jgi:hypothetical protein
MFYFTKQNYFHSSAPKNITDKVHHIPHLVAYGPFFFCTKECRDKYVNENASYILELKKKSDWSLTPPPPLTPEQMREFKEKYLLRSTPHS